MTKQTMIGINEAIEILKKEYAKKTQRLAEILGQDDELGKIIRDMREIATPNDELTFFWRKKGARILPYQKEILRIRIKGVGLGSVKVRLESLVPPVVDPGVDDFKNIEKFVNVEDLDPTVVDKISEWIRINLQD